jgi:hypothetical protein
MTAFELFFGLTSIILGLALTHLANSFQFLLRRGREVRWAVEPMLQAVLILMIVVFVWADQWENRNAAAFSIGQSLLQILKLLAVYVAAASVLPEPNESANADLHAYYLASHRVTYGALIAGLLLFVAYRYLFLPPSHVPLFNSIFQVGSILALYVALMIVRRRFFHIGALIVLCLAYAVQIIPRTIGG